MPCGDTATSLASLKIRKRFRGGLVVNNPEIWRGLSKLHTTDAKQMHAISRSLARSKRGLSALFQADKVTSIILNPKDLEQVLRGRLASSKSAVHTPVGGDRAMLTSELQPAMLVFLKRVHQ